MLSRQPILWTLTAAALAAGMLAGCGQKGPLYLPAPAVAPAAQVEANDTPAAPRPDALPSR